MTAIRVAVVDDHKIFRTGIITSLKSYEDIQVVLQAGDGEELLTLLQTTSVDVILLDIKMPVLNGIEVLKTIRKSDQKIKILILTMYEEETYVVELLDAKANGYLIKNTDPEEIYQAIKSSFETGFYFTDFIKDILAIKMLGTISANSNESQKIPELTEREINVLQLICDQKTTIEISKLLNLSIRTIENIRSQLLLKTETKNTAGLVLSAFKNQLLR